MIKLSVLQFDKMLKFQYFAFFFRYEGPLLEETLFTNAVNEAPVSAEYTMLVEWLILQLSSFHGTEHTVQGVACTNEVH